MRAGMHREFTYLCELVGITAVVVAQPVFDIVQAAPEELVARRARPLEIVAFALIVVVAPPLLLWIGEQAVRLFAPGARDLVHAAVLGVGVGIFSTEVLKSMLGREGRPWLAVVGLAVAVLAAALMVRRPSARLLLRYLAVAGPAFLGLFLFASPVSELVVSHSVEAVDVTVGDPAPVVLIALDEFPEVSMLDGQGNIDADTYPALAALAGDSTWFRNHTGVSPLTPSALPAILTGQLPEALFPAPVSTRFNESIFTLLGDSYDVRAIEHLTDVCPPDICARERSSSSVGVVRSLLSTGLEVFGSVADPWVDQRSLEFVVNRAPNDPLAPMRVETFAQQLTPGRRPTLDFLHVLLPHQPWDWLASGRTYEAPDPPRSAEFGSWHDQTTADEGRQRHLLQLQYTDRLLGDVVDQMEASGLYDDALVIVTADHGIGFVGGEPLRAVSEANYHEVMWTPLLVKLPGQTEGEVDDRPVETIDIVPTIADVLDVDIPWEVDGVSVFEPREDRPARMFDWRFHEVEAEGDYVVLDRDEGFDRVLAGSTPLAGHPDDPDAVLRLGTYGSLIGTAADQWATGPAPGIEVQTRSMPSFTVARDATDLPAYVEGAWAGEPQGWVAAVVDGTVAGLGLSYPQGEGFATFWTMLSERLLTPGDHELALYALSGPASAPTLHPLEMIRPNR